MQIQEPVIIKGVREGLLLILDDDVAFAEVLTSLSQRISAQPNFFVGAAVIVNTGRRVMDRPDFDVLYRMLTRNGMRVQSFVSLSAQSRMVAESYGVTSRPPSFAAGDSGASLGLKSRGAQWVVPTTLPEEGVPEMGTGLFLRCSLRPGQSVRYGGDVCVLGNVDAGAEIVADGDIVVWGSLRGLAHAGAAGDSDAVVCALELSPVQLSIGGVSSRFPNFSTLYPDLQQPPQLARLERNQIVVEAWQPEDR